MRIVDNPPRADDADSMVQVLRQFRFVIEVRENVGRFSVFFHKQLPA
jgi:hypothetical protein